MSLPTLNVRSFLDDNVSHIKPEYRRAFEERLSRFLAAWLGDFETSLRELEDDHEKLLAAAHNENRARAEEERVVITKLRESLEVLRVEERDARTQLRESYDKLLRDQRNELLHAWRESSKAWEEGSKKERLAWAEFLKKELYERDKRHEQALHERDRRHAQALEEQRQRYFKEIAGRERLIADLRERLAGRSQPPPARPASAPQPSPNIDVSSPPQATTPTESSGPPSVHRPAPAAPEPLPSPGRAAHIPRAQLVPTVEALEIVGFSSEMLLSLARQGAIPGAQKLTTGWRFPPQELLRLRELHAKWIRKPRRPPARPAPVPQPSPNIDVSPPQAATPTKSSGPAPAAQEPLPSPNIDVSSPPQAATPTESSGPPSVDLSPPPPQAAPAAPEPPPSERPPARPASAPQPSPDIDVSSPPQAATPTESSGPPSVDLSPPPQAQLVPTVEALEIVELPSTEPSSPAPAAQEPLPSPSRADIPESSGPPSVDLSPPPPQAAPATPEPPPSQRPPLSREYLRALGIPTRQINAWIRDGILTPDFERTPEVTRLITEFLDRG
ncbi:MAG: hypothetical protein IPK80_35105 [Nannocystis sp.]|nr:hypothetical protein [Nannocystis sp.]